MKILVTGGAGFIGSHLAEALLTRGADLAIIDNLDDFYSPLLKKQNLAEVSRKGHFQLYETDIRNAVETERVFATTRPDVVIHLAARAGVRPSMGQPQLYEQVNVSGTVNLLESCRTFRVPKFIFGSSSSVYGGTPRVPFSEDELGLHPVSPYAATKLSAEIFCFTYAHLYRISMICLRFFTVYGPRQRPDLAIHKFTSLLECGKPLPIFGDGSMGRDYTYVGDIVSGVLSALEYEPGNPKEPFELFNLGNSHPVTLLDLVEHLEHATGHAAIRRFEQVPPGDVPITWADISKARRLLNYFPSTALSAGLRHFVDWYRSEHKSVGIISGAA